VTGGGGGGGDRRVWREASGFGATLVNIEINFCNSSRKKTKNWNHRGNQKLE
jgi:hypothetical protein